MTGAAIIAEDMVRENMVGAGDGLVDDDLACGAAFVCARGGAEIAAVTGRGGKGWAKGAVRIGASGTKMVSGMNRRNQTVDFGFREPPHPHRPAVQLALRPRAGGAGPRRSVCGALP